MGAIEPIDLPETGLIIGTDFPTQDETAYMREAQAQRIAAQHAAGAGAVAQDAAAYTDQAFRGQAGGSLASKLSGHQQALLDDQVRHVNVASWLELGAQNIIQTKTTMNEASSDYHRAYEEMWQRAQAEAWPQHLLSNGKGELVTESQDKVRAARAAFEDRHRDVSSGVSSGDDSGAGGHSVAGDNSAGNPPAKDSHIRMAGFDPNQIPEGPASQYFDPDHPFVGDERFGHWAKYVPPPYTGDGPPPPIPEHVQFPDGMPAKTGGPSGFYTPGQTWVTDDQAPYASLAEEYKFRISGQDLTSFTRTAAVDGQPELQRWVANTYEAQKITQVNLNGDAWAKTDPNELEGTLGGVTTGGLSGAGGVPFFGDWKPMTPAQMAVLSAANPTATYYIPDGCGDQFTFKGGSPVGGVAPGPVIPRLTAGP